MPTDSTTVSAAIERVIASFDGNPRDQVLVQAMVGGVTSSGVAVTTDLDRGGPYVTIESDTSGHTDRVTGGTGLHRRVLVHRRGGARLVTDPRIRRVLCVVDELERWWPDRTLEVEFAENAHVIHVLQVRFVVPARRWTSRSDRTLDCALRGVEQDVVRGAEPQEGIAGTSTILGTMPDWNPAELIGVVPSPLAASILAYLVTDRVWSDARRLLGYRATQRPLVRLLVGRPYVDVRLSFNSLLPAALPDDNADPIVDAWLARLHASPALHDKIEFEVAQTAWDLDAGATLRRRYGGELSHRTVDALATHLRALTARLVTDAPTGSLARARDSIEQAAEHYRPVRAPGAARGATNHTQPRASVEPTPTMALALLADCRRYDALPFAVIARHAFIAEAMLRSAVRRGALAPGRVTAFKQTLSTVTQEFRQRLVAVRRGAVSAPAFLREFGHLRPGSFDITSARYDAWIDPARTGATLPDGTSVEEACFSLRSSERRALDRLLGEAGLGVDATGLLRYAAAAIVGRERAKFLMTRRLSDALEVLAAWAPRAELTRDAVAHVPLRELARCTRLTPVDQRSMLRRRATEANIRRVEFAQMRMAHLIRSPADVWVIESNEAQPTFVTTRSVVAPVVPLAPTSAGDTRLAGQIVCIESADPGYDWIFTEPLGGLVTCFGGANSHMGIRCTELGVPAALGVGEAVFERVARAARVELRCGEQILRPVCDTVWA